MGGCRQGVLPRHLNAVGADRQLDLLGKLHAARSRGSVQKGITIYISSNTNDNPEWQATIRHIAIEGMCFFVNAGMVIRRSSYPSDLHEGDVASRFPEYVCRGGSCIVDPRGHYVTEPVWDEEAVIYTELDMGLSISCKMEHDVAGHYARPDVLELNVNER